MALPTPHLRPLSPATVPSGGSEQAETVCLRALCGGAATAKAVAITTGLSLEATQRTLADLAGAGLASASVDGRRWQATPDGQLSNRLLQAFGAGMGEPAAAHAEPPRTARKHKGATGRAAGTERRGGHICASRSPSRVVAGMPVRSDRVCAVLALVAERRQVRIADVSDALGVGKQSINALFQYLKRKALVAQEAHGAPYVLTEHGREVLAEMQRRRAE